MEIELEILDLDIKGEPRVGLQSPVAATVVLEVFVITDTNR